MRIKCKKDETIEVLRKEVKQLRLNGIITGDISSYNKQKYYLNIDNIILSECGLFFMIYYEDGFKEKLYVETKPERDKLRERLSEYLDNSMSNKNIEEKTTKLGTKIKRKTIL